MATVINCFKALKCPKDVFLGGLRTLVSHNRSKSSAQHASNTTSDITRLFWQRQDGRRIFCKYCNLSYVSVAPRVELL